MLLNEPFATSVKPSQETAVAFWGSGGSQNPLPRATYCYVTGQLRTTPEAGGEGHVASIVDKITVGTFCQKPTDVTRDKPASGNDVI
jgi:hypothetical protein